MPKKSTLYCYLISALTDNFIARCRLTAPTVRAHTFQHNGSHCTHI